MSSSTSKLLSIDEQIKALQEKKKKLEERSLLDLAKVIKKLGADSVPVDVFVGALLETVEAFQQKKDIVKKWQAKGKDFLEADKSKKRSNSSNSFRNSEQNIQSAAEIN